MLAHRRFLAADLAGVLMRLGDRRHGQRARRRLTQAARTIGIIDAIRMVRALQRL
jgi:hypothetical protein